IHPLYLLYPQNNRVTLSTTHLCQTVIRVPAIQRSYLVVTQPCLHLFFLYSLLKVTCFYFFITLFSFHLGYSFSNNLMGQLPNQAYPFFRSSDISEKS